VIARVNAALQLEKIDVWYDPMEMFRQIAREEKGQNLSGLSADAAGCPFSKSEAS
jgi:hypothetical protein